MATGFQFTVALGHCSVKIKCTGRSGSKRGRWETAWKSDGKLTTAPSLGPTLIPCNPSEEWPIRFDHVLAGDINSNDVGASTLYHVKVSAIYWFFSDCPSFPHLLTNYYIKLHGLFENLMNSIEYTQNPILMQDNYFTLCWLILLNSLNNLSAANLSVCWDLAFAIIFSPKNSVFYCWHYIIANELAAIAHFLNLIAMTYFLYLLTMRISYWACQKDKIHHLETLFQRLIWPATSAWTEWNW